MHASMVHINELLGENAYLTGSDMTVADIFIFNNFQQTSMDITMEYPQGCSALKAWIEKMESVPSVDVSHKRFIEVKAPFAAKQAE